MAWNPESYLAFAGQRTRPAAELLARVRSENPERVIDLGCGPGNSTRLLAACWPQTRLEGLDNSAAMLAEARGQRRAGHMASGRHRRLGGGRAL